MGKIKLLNSSENGYFANNQIDIADSIPTSGSYKVGDIIIKSTQTSGQAIGWICVQAGTPGIWSEFGGMLTDERELIINPESVGMDELSSEIKAQLVLLNSVNTSVRQIQNDLKDYATKEDLEKIDLSDYATKEDLENVEVDLSPYATKEELNNNVNNFMNNVGNLSSLNTSNKTIVGAINEVFQAGNNVKQNLVDALIAKGVSGVSTSDSWSDLITFIASPYFFYKEEKWYVENISGTTYNFKLNSNGYYESSNKGVHSSYSICKLVISNPLGKNVTMTYINSGESSYDYGIVSNLNNTLSLSSSADSSYLLNCKGSSSTSAKTLSLGKVDGFYYIKFIKDGSQNSGNDSFQFKITMS